MSLQKQNKDIVIHCGSTIHSLAVCQLQYGNGEAKNDSCPGITLMGSTSSSCSVSCRLFTAAISMWAPRC